MNNVLVTLVLIIKLINSYKVSVMLKQGKLLGSKTLTLFDQRHYFAFYGVPYARSPVGRLRFKDPIPSRDWSGAYDARTDYRGTCGQNHIGKPNSVFGVEDCLYLNIFTPEIPSFNRFHSNKLKAVIVWFHGYGFTSSFSHIYGPDFLLDHNIIVVTVTYRLGVFGYMKLNETDSHSNMGLKDIAMSLKWIKNNIEHFYGDKKRITVMGSGSAADSLSLLLMTKKRKLFSKMILHSGSLFSPSMMQTDPLYEAYKVKKALKVRGYPNPLVPDMTLVIETTKDMYTTVDKMNFQRNIVPFAPTKENKSKDALITCTPEEFLKTNRLTDLKMPILIGFSSQEGIADSAPLIQNPKYLKVLQDFFRFLVPYSEGCQYNYTSRTYKKIAADIKLHYFKNNVTEKSIEQYLKYTSDLLKYPIYKFITVLSKRNASTFVYKFDRKGEFSAFRAHSIVNSKVKVKGAASGDELCYIFKCEPYGETYVKALNDLKNVNFIKSMSEMWANFAKSSNPTPNSYRQIEWPPFTPENKNMLFIGTEFKVVNSQSEEAMLKFWNELRNKYYTKAACRKHRGIKDEL